MRRLIEGRLAVMKFIQFGFPNALGGTGSDDKCPAAARCSCHRRHVFQVGDVSLNRA